MPKLLTSLRWGFRRHRRLFAALAVGVAVLAGLSAFTQNQAVAPVLVATRDITGGSQLTSTDVEQAWWPTQVVPERVLTEPTQIDQQTLVASVTAGSPLTETDLLTADSLVNAGMVALPVTFTSSSPIELLRVGGVIDLIGTDAASGATKILANEVRVVSISTAESGAFSSTASVVLVEVTPQTAAQLSAAASISSLGFALR